MLPSPKIVLATTLASLGLLAGCSILDPGQMRAARLRVDHGSFRMTQPVDADGTIGLAGTTKLLGSIEAGPIFEAEGRTPSTVQVMLHDGCYYIVDDDFHNLWLVKPRPGETWATYRPIPLPVLEIANIRLSRYGPPDRTCVRLDFDGGGPWYVTEEGALGRACL